MHSTSCRRVESRRVGNIRKLESKLPTTQVDSESHDQAFERLEVAIDFRSCGQSRMESSVASVTQGNGNNEEAKIDDQQI